jgi:formiminotetrahydrofolate cyclodeaminase
MTMQDIKDTSIEIFLDALASKQATPGGGSAAAIMGAQSAALTSMVCQLTIGKLKYAAVEREMTSLLNKSEALRVRLIKMIQQDINAFDGLMACYAMPKSNEAETKTRSIAIQQALKIATEVPLACVRACAEAIDLSAIAAEKGNITALSDAGVAAMAGNSAAKSAALNVYINIASLKDKQFAEACTTGLEDLLKKSTITAERTYLLVKEKL